MKFEYAKTGNATARTIAKTNKTVKNVFLISKPPTKFNYRKYFLSLYQVLSDKQVLIAQFDDQTIGSLNILCNAIY